MGLCSVKTHHPICQDFDGVFFFLFFCIISSSDDRIESSAILRHWLLAHDYGFSVECEFDAAQWYASRQVKQKTEKCQTCIHKIAEFTNNMLSRRFMFCYCYY